MSKKKEYNISKASLHVSIVSVCIAIWAIVWSCETGGDLVETNYKIASVEHRPRIKFLNPKLTGLDLTLDPTATVRANQKTDTVDISMNLKLRLRIKFVNIGNSDAKILGYILPLL
jgi:hypothetical protein